MEDDKKYIINIRVDTADGAEEYEIDAATIALDKLASIIEFHPELAGLYFARWFKEAASEDDQ